METRSGKNRQSGTGDRPGDPPSYADDEWEARIRSKSLGKREVAALKAYYEPDGAPGLYIGGYDTNCRLDARGLIETSTGKYDHTAFRITAAGKEEWLRWIEAK